MELTLLWAAFTGVAAAWLAATLLRRARRMPAWMQRPLDFVITAIAAGLLVGRLASMMSDGVNPLRHPADIVLLRGGVHTGFATLGALAAVVWILRPRIVSGLDALAPVALAGLAGWHAGCLWRGECLGTPSSLPWAWAAHPGSVRRHPVELYAALLLAAAALLLAILRRLPAGAAAGLALAVAAAVRLGTEPLRPSLTGGPVGWYVAGIVVGMGGVLVAVALRERAAPP